MEKRKIKVVTNKGVRYTIIISKESEDFIQGHDKYGLPIKLEMDEIRQILPISGTQW